MRMRPRAPLMVKLSDLAYIIGVPADTLSRSARLAGARKMSYMANGPGTKHAHWYLDLDGCNRILLAMLSGQPLTLARASLRDYAKRQRAHARAEDMHDVTDGPDRGPGGTGMGNPTPIPAPVPRTKFSQDSEV